MTLGSFTQDGVSADYLTNYRDGQAGPKSTTFPGDFLREAGRGESGETRTDVLRSHLAHLQALNTTITGRLARHQLSSDFELLADLAEALTVLQEGFATLAAMAEEEASDGQGPTVRVLPMLARREDEESSGG